EGAIASKFRNAGQTCICANRIYVQNSVFDEFTARLTAKVKAMKIGRGDEEGVQIGPLINERGLEKVKAHVFDALQKGGKLVCGGKQHDAGALFYEPTIITNMKPDMILKDEETFGPVAGIFKFTDEADVIAQANDTRYGLASYFYSNDLGQCFRVAEALEHGMVGINEPLLATESAPFGGMKESGYGRENSHYGMDDFVDIKYVLVGGIN
ncbi:MAG TPA: aldehyde dehydrogenase family protein, partial [Alphaproteobacteria bacterium]